jgi:hypothetical protein
MEITGGLQPIATLPGRFPVIHNTTLIRASASETPSAVHFMQYGGGYFHNSILLHPGSGVQIQYTEAPGDAWSLFESGRLALKSNILFPDADPVNPYMTYSELGEELPAQNEMLADSAVSWLTSFEDPGIRAGETYDLLPPTTEFDDLAPYEEEWFEQVRFKGAFGSNNWIEGWTLLYESGLVND